MHYTAVCGERRAPHSTETGRTLAMGRHLPEWSILNSQRWNSVLSFERGWQQRDNGGNRSAMVQYGCLKVASGLSREKRLQWRPDPVGVTSLFL